MTAMDDGIIGQGATARTTAEAYLCALKTHGVDYVFANAGTDFAPIIEALVQANDSGADIPQFVTVPHENVAMSMAQGYYKVSGKMAGVMVHVTVGTANAMCGLINASRDNVPLLLAAGRTPLTESGDPGSRNIPIHWGQEAFDQGGMTREYVKWDYELRTGQPVDSVVARALDIAMTGPRGPVYLTLPREVLGGAAVVPGPGGVRNPGALPAAPSAEAIERIADAIAGAENPLIVSGGTFHGAAAFAALSEIADEHALAVTEISGGSMATSHRMNLGGRQGGAVKDADVIVVLDGAVPWVPRFGEPSPDATIVQIAADPTFQYLPFRSHRADMAIAGEPSLAVPLLRDALVGKLKNKQAVVDVRRKRIGERRDAIDELRAKQVAEARDMSPIHPAWTAHCLNQIKDDDAIIVNELGLRMDLVESNQPGCYLAGGAASGLGRGLGEALGAKLAAPDRQVIAAVGDGSYMFCVPTAAHYVGRSEGLPTLTLVSNNAEWFAVRNATMGMYPDGRASKANKLPLVELSPSPSFEKTIEACGGYGEAVEDPAELPGALERAFQAVADGNSALLNIKTRSGARN
jgi:acetolactate synthase-1/2/3 large subunit